MLPLLPSLAAFFCVAQATDLERALPITVGSVIKPFDGKSLADWEGDMAYWSVKDGAIVGQTTAARPLGESTYLVWKGGELRDFELTFEYRLVGGNSGVHIRSFGAAPLAIRGLQADIDAGPDFNACLYEHGGRGLVAMRGQISTWFDNSTQRSIEFADADKLNGVARAEQWNRYKVRAIGNRVDLELNGYPMCTFLDRDVAKFTPAGLLALQLHEGAPMKVEFRGLELRTLSSAVAEDQVGQARWIWTKAEPRDDDRAWFGKVVPLAQAAPYARLEGSGDDACEVRIDGKLVFENDDWQKPMWVELEGGLSQGLHKIEIRAKNGSGRSGVQFALDLVMEDRSRERIITDSSWHASAVEPPADWLAKQSAGGAVELGRLGTQPWGMLQTARSYTQSQALDAASISVLPGFEAELLYAVPRTLEGSWVALCFDNAGRLYTSDQLGGLYRVTLTADSTRPRTIEEVRLPIRYVQGLAWAFDALYAVAALPDGERPMGLYRLRDTNEDDQLDEVSLLSPFKGEGGEHGPHAVVLGPDGTSLYVIAGNHTSLPEPLIHSRVPRLWGEDQLLARREDPRGHALGVAAPGGWLARTNADGAAWELVAAGMRNAYDVAFDHEGEAFTFDSDMEWDRALPWYRPTRILHLASGADFGWRRGSGKWPDWLPDSLPSVVDVGAGSPTGVAFGALSNFPTVLRKALFAGDWARGRILAVQLEPNGTSYAGRVIEFASGRPLPVTDLAFGRDGALYFVTGGRNARSGLYRLRWTGGELEPAASEGAEAEAAADEQTWSEMRAMRRNVEGFHRDAQGEAPVDGLVRLLDNNDRFLRHAVRTALEHQPVETWGAQALLASSPQAALQAALALARAAPSVDLTMLLGMVTALDFEQLDSAQQRDWLRAIELGLIRRGLPSDEVRERLIALLSPRFENADAAFERKLCEILVALGDPSIVPRALARLEQEPSPARALGLAWPLRVAHQGWTRALHERYFAWIGRMRASLAGGASFEMYLEGMTSDALLGVEESAQDAMRKLAEPPPPAAAIELPAGREKRDPTLRWTLEELAQIVRENKGVRSFANGRLAYARARCADCHTIAGAGGNSGPDLTSVAGRLSPYDLLEAIVVPSATISDQYKDTLLFLKDDAMLVGRFVDAGDETSVRFATAPPHESVVEIEKADIMEVRDSKLSRMPEGLLDQLTESDVLDLLEFVLAGGVLEPKARD